jgi:hypothetical protein
MHRPPTNWITSKYKSSKKITDFYFDVKMPVLIICSKIVQILGQKQNRSSEAELKHLLYALKRKYLYISASL